jgi:hypothetical protein
MISFNLLINAQLKRVLVTETTVKIDKKSSKQLYFGFDKGDKVLVSLDMQKGRKLKQINFYEHPDTQLSDDYKIKKALRKTIKINERGIYVFDFTNSSVFSKMFHLKIERVPANDKNTDFNTTVYWKTFNDTTFQTITKEIDIKKYEIKTVIPLSSFYINSGSNATLLGGKSRITFPLNLPKNTIKCYYQFAAAKNKDEIGKLTNLSKQLSGIFADTKSIDINTEDLIEPLGRVYCDIYLLDKENSYWFENKKAYKYIPEGSRRNIKSGVVEIPNTLGSNLYIGIRNPLKIYGIHVNFEASAIIQTIEKKYEKVKDPNNYKVNIKRVPYLKTNKDSE